MHRVTRCGAIILLVEGKSSDSVEFLPKLQLQKEKNGLIGHTSIECARSKRLGLALIEERGR